MLQSYYHLEFNKIIQLIKSECHSRLGEKQIDLIAPISDKKDKLTKIKRIGQIQRLIIQGYSYSFEDLFEIEDLLLDWKHESYNFEEFTAIIKTVIIANLIVADKEAFTDYHLFLNQVKLLNEFKDIEKRYFMIFNAEGEVLDSASKELASIRKRKRQLREHIVKELGAIQRDQSWDNFIQDKIISHRDDRFVILIKEGATGFVDGISHGRSSSNSSVYFEPKQVVGLNNDLNKMDADEKKEIYRIFCEYTSQIQEIRQEVYTNNQVLTLMDSEFAIGRFSNRIMASIPVFVDEPVLVLQKARHPLLINQFKDIQKVIPFNLELGKDKKILLISGPNTGGKTITLKTIGLVTLMAHSGLPVPVDSDSKIGFFNQVFADIGDNQSIESYLSSFSAHMKHISEMIEKGDERTLVLIDEIGSATDPEQGSALAQAVLEKLVEKRVTGVITTHYTALKIFAEQSEVCVNASMQFDAQQHLPTYQFQFGLPGHSFAIEIAAGLGINQDIIQRAKYLTGNQSVELTELLAKMTEEKKKLARATYEHELKGRLLEQKTKEKEQELSAFESQKKKMLREVLNDTKEEFVHLQKEMLRDLEEIKKLNREERKTKLEESLKKATKIQEDIHHKSESFYTGRKNNSQTGEITAGSVVWVKKMDTIATVIEITKDSAKVDLNGICFSVPLSNLALQKSKTERLEAIVSNKNAANPPSAKLELKVLGLTFDEALPLVDEFIDHALINGLNRVRIVHGKGTGVLRSKIRSYLKKNKRVTDFYAPPPEAGGDGVTVVCFS